MLRKGQFWDAFGLVIFIAFASGRVSGKETGSFEGIRLQECADEVHWLDEI